MTPLVLDDVLKKIHALPSLQTVVMELLASIDQDDTHIGDLAFKIEQDQALTAKTLRLANSSFYGMQRQITTIEEAIATLGFRTVRGVVTAAALTGFFANSQQAAFEVTPFWRHAIATAVCARELAPYLQLNPEHAYTTGLLHDIGRLVLATQFPTHYKATMAYGAQHDCSLLIAERTVLGLDHAVVGHALTRHWKFPETIQQALATHHAPLGQVPNPMQLVVIAADAIAHALDLSMEQNDAVPLLPPGIWKQLAISDSDLLQVFAKVEAQFARASLVLDT
ncbi:MAG: histidine kinase [Burkholderiales bacterium RIFCSPLOWO2_12_FULL_61_40]|nr:MAG: histidine kinase [Burkholderiales bacterium RIFCSPLOWO2_12_FULL_61_40]